MSPLVLALAWVCVQDRVENPEYRHWASFAPGSKVKRQIAYKASDKTITIGETITLKSVDEKGLVLEKSSSTLADGRRFDSPPTEFKVEATIEARAAPSVVRESDEEIEVAGKKLKCRRVQLLQEDAAKKTEIVEWRSDEIPGRVARRELKFSTGGHSSEVAVEWEKK
jgi:hypothetical protein